jgi:hypothetical protein
MTTIKYNLLVEAYKRISDKQILTTTNRYNTKILYYIIYYNKK